MTCQTCQHARPGPQEGIFCHRYPPTAQAVSGPTPPTPAQPNGGWGTQIIRVRPNVTPDEVCGEYRARLATLSPIR